MATAVASRFAVLPDDVDDEYSNRKRRPPAAKKPENAKSTAPNNKQAASAKPAAPKKKKNKENVQQAKPKQKTETPAAPVKKKPVEVPPEQWEEWKQKDEQLAAVNYKEELKEALMLSKMDYEEKKDFYKKQAVEATKVVEEAKGKQGKKGKKPVKVMTVEEFLSLGKEKSREESPSTTGDREDEGEFFNRLQQQIGEQLVRDERKKEMSPKKERERQPLSEEALTLAQIKDALDKRLEEVEALKSENIELKEELKQVKTRNKKLCNILANGEMKEKAEVLMQVERLEVVRDELSEEVSQLHILLEQERSKVRLLNNEIKRDKTKKRTTSSGDH